MIRIYVYKLADGRFMYEDTGLAQYVIHDLGNDKDFTLTPPPDYEHQWRWVDSKWTTDDTAN